MSDFDVYENDMSRRSLTEQDVERLLDRAIDEQGDMARFAAILQSLHRTGPTTPSDEVVAAFSARAAEIARASSNHTFATTQIKPRPDRHLERRLVGALGAAVFLTGMTGVAVAADGASPGDVLYGLDRAMESVGVDAGGPSERITEAMALLEKGQITAAIAQAAEAVEAADVDGQQGLSAETASAVNALRGAAERVEAEQGNGENQIVHGAVAGILNEIAMMLESEELSPSDFGGRISELARGIGRNGEDNESESGETPGSAPAPQNETPPGGPPDTPKGPPDDVPAGPPDGVPGAGAGRP